MFSKKEEIWSYRTFLKIFARFGRTLIDRQLLFTYRESFLYTGMMSANFKIDRKVDKLIDSLTQPKVKGEKKSLHFVSEFLQVYLMNGMLYLCLNSSFPFLCQ